MSAVARAIPAAHDPARDFDFLFGRWQVRNERLRERLADCTEWEHFDAEVETRPVLGGLGNREHFQTDWQNGYHGLALRLFDCELGQWRIWWASDRSPMLEAPVLGGFDGDVGNFYSRIEHTGRDVLCRYRWTRIDADHARWDQAYSVDEGASWECNWVMHFTRAETHDVARA